MDRLLSHLARVALLRQPDNTLQPGEPAGKVTSGLGIAIRPGRLFEDGARYGSLLCIDTPGHMPAISTSATPRSTSATR